MIDITERNTFIGMSAFCIIFGLIMGAVCNFLFYTVSHIVLFNGMTVSGTQIPTLWGAIFILIMAATALMIALTFRYIPGWVAYYLQNHKVPPAVVNLILYISKMKKDFDERFGQDEEE